MGALERLNEKVHDIIISDIGMPDMDGYEFMRRVRSVQVARQVQQLQAWNHLKQTRVQPKPGTSWIGCRSSVTPFYRPGLLCDLSARC
jgi:DNA-binding NtrC family response regulator